MTPAGLLGAEKIGEPVLLYVFRKSLQPPSFAGYAVFASKKLQFCEKSDSQTIFIIKLSVSLFITLTQITWVVVKG